MIATITAIVARNLAHLMRQPELTPATPVTEYGGPASHDNGRAVDPQRWIDQRNRQRGRALMLVIKAKLESIESGVETFEEAFLANIVTANRQTVYERIAGTLAVEYETGKVAPLMLGGPGK